MLKDSRVKVNEPNQNGETPLWYAAFFGYLDIIKWRIASGREMDLGKPGDVDKTDAIGSNLVTLPESLCNPHPLPPFVTLSRATHASSFLSFPVSLTNLVDLDLHGNDHLDFGALSQWLNRFSVISLDFFF